MVREKNEWEEEGAAVGMIKEKKKREEEGAAA